MDNPWATDNHHWPEHADALNGWTTSYDGDASPVESRQASPGGFGTFESADSTETAWSAAWAPPVDEWELAKRQKQVQDQHAPPELLTSILDQLRALSTDLWPEPGSDDGENRQPCNDFLSEVPSLKSAVDKYVPDDLILSANVQFSRTFTSKHMNEALRLTRHLPMTLSSPMSVYIASKGLTSWEAFVKSRPDISQDDALLPGWRMVEKTERESTPAPEVKKKTGGGLLSFLGLKGSDSSGTEPQKPSPSSSSRPASIIGSIKSSRSSLDGSAKPSSERRSSISQPSTLTTAMTSPSNPSPPGPVASPHTEQGLAQDAVQQAAPSVMGRFFGRFSRSSATSSNQAVQSRSHSLALSSDDIEFLTDIVPSANDDVDEDENLKSLINMISAKTPSSLSATPLPQPLPPPPRSVRPNPSSLPLASDSFHLLDSVVAEQRPTNATIRPLTPAVPSTNEPASQPMSKLTTAPPMTVLRPQTHLPVRAPLPQRRSFTAVMTCSGRSTPSSLQVPLPLPPLPPPPYSPSRAIPPPQNGPVPQPTSLFADDDFSDFLSSPAMPNPPSQPSTTRGIFSSIRIDASSSSTSSTQSFSSTVSDRSLLQSSSFDFRLDGFANSGKSNSRQSNLQLLEDEFDEFVSSPMTPALRTPPPRPPPKMTLSIMAPAPQGLNLMRNRDRESLPPPPPPLKASRADHSRTSSLSESAEARPGRWPAPPLPQVIGPPPPPPLPPPRPSSSRNHHLGMFDDAGDETLTRGKGRLQTLTNTLSVSRSGLAAPPPLRALNPLPMASKANGVTTGTRTAFWSLDANGSKPLAPTKAVTGSSNKTVGGLSAQDISFFEGL